MVSRCLFCEVVTPHVNTLHDIDHFRPRPSWFLLLDFHPKSLIPFRVESILKNHYNPFFPRYVRLHILSCHSLAYLAKLKGLITVTMTPTKVLTSLMETFMVEPCSDTIYNDPFKQWNDIDHFGSRPA